MNADATLLACVHSFPVLSGSAVRLSEMLGDEQTSIAEFEVVIRPDVTLTANLLRAANSAHFGLPRKVTSVRQAVSLLGRKKLFDIAMGAAFHSLLPKIVPGYGMNTREFWAHAVAVAVLSEQLAHDIEGVVPDTTFTLGLLHDLGKLAIASVLERELVGIQARLSAGDDLMTAEQDVLGFDHAAAGAMLLQVWKLPESFADPIRFHHRPGKAAPGEPRQLAELLHLADGLAHNLGFGADVGEMSRSIDMGMVERLCLSDVQLEGIAARSVGPIHQLVEALAPAGSDANSEQEKTLPS